MIKFLFTHTLFFVCSCSLQIPNDWSIIPPAIIYLIFLSSRFSGEPVGATLRVSHMTLQDIGRLRRVQAPRNWLDVFCNPTCVWIPWIGRVDKILRFIWIHLDHRIAYSLIASCWFNPFWAVNCFVLLEKIQNGKFNKRSQIKTEISSNI